MNRSTAGGSDGFVLFARAVVRPREDDLSPLARLTYIALASHADRDGVCFPTIETLSGDTGIPRRSVQRAIVELESRKLVEIAVHGAGRANRYRLLLLAPLRHSGASPPTNGASFEGNSASFEGNSAKPTLGIAPEWRHNEKLRNETQERDPGMRTMPLRRTNREIATRLAPGETYADRMRANAARGHGAAPADGR